MGKLSDDMPGDRAAKLPACLGREPTRDGVEFRAGDVASGAEVPLYIAEN